MTEFADANIVAAINPAPPESNGALAGGAEQIWADVEHLCGRAVDEVKTHPKTTLVVAATGAALLWASRGSIIGTLGRAGTEASVGAEASAGAEMADGSIARLVSQAGVLTKHPETISISWGQREGLVGQARDLSLHAEGYDRLAGLDAAAIRYFFPSASRSGTSDVAPLLGAKLEKVKAGITDLGGVPGTIRTAVEGALDPKSEIPLVSADNEAGFAAAVEQALRGDRAVMMSRSIGNSHPTTVSFDTFLAAARQNGASVVAAASDDSSAAVAENGGAAIVDFPDINRSPLRFSQGMGGVKAP